MKLEDIPRNVLSHTGCAVCGFLIALWCQETTVAGQNHRKLKPGFTITFKSREENIRDQDPETNDGLALISKNTNDACRWTNSGALIRRREKFIQVMGDIETLDSAVKIVEGIKAGYMVTTTQKRAEAIAPCHELPLITYGPHP